MTIKHEIGCTLQSYRNIAVWGAGGLGTLALDKWLPKNRVAMVIDADVRKHGKDFHGHQISCPSKLAGSSIDCLILCVSTHRKALKQARSLGFDGPVFYIYELMLSNTDSMTQLDMLRIDWHASKNEPLLRFLAHRPQFLVNVTYGLCRATAGSVMLSPLYALFTLMHILNCILFSIQLPRRASIGPGLVFPHFGGIVVAPDARIGAFFTIYQGCTVGRNQGRAPLIGDFVTQFASSVVLGECNIGNHCQIGAMSLVLDMACPEGTTLTGIPARPR